jgi:co-chaperonin GroES (HSP10)
MSKLENPSGLEAVGRAVLCKPYDPELNQTTIAIPDHVKELELMREMRATVVQIGANCWPDEPPRAQAGDRVLISKFCGAIVKGPADGQHYRLINDNDIFCRITSDAWDNMVSKDPISKSKEVLRGTSEGRMSVPTRR